MIDSSAFSHLHLHTEYSLLDGANKIDNLIIKAKELGMKSVAITDHGNMFGAIEFYTKLKKAGIKPIIGIETYIHNHEKLDDKTGKKRFHLCLLAKNDIGYKNLMYLSSMAYTEGFYYNARINKKLLKSHSEGIVAMSACLQGEVSWHLNTQNPKNKKNGAKGYDEAVRVALEYKEIFGEDFYLEIMRHGIDDQYFIDDMILKIAKQTGIEIVATNDTHYTEQKDAISHEAFMCIAMNKLFDDPKRMKHSVHEFYLKSPQQIQKLYADIPQAIANTQKIVDKCNLNIKLGNPTPPNFKFAREMATKYGIEIPQKNKEYSLDNDKVLFEYLCKKGLEKILEKVDEKSHSIYRQRVDDEIQIINNMKFSGYMLIVWEFVQFAKLCDPPIPVGPGRGSAAGSLVAYALSITNIDPIKYGLIFERFLNPDRVSMPDIDMDFCQNRRQEVIDYVVEKYGRQNVAQIITFGKLLAKGVIRDVARVLDLPLSEADKMAKMIPDKIGISLAQAQKDEPKIDEYIQSNPLAQKVWQHSLALEGLNRNASTHAAGVVISNEPLYQKTPLFRPSGDDIAVATQYNGKYIEDVDLIKFDFLGLKTLTVINDTLKLIKDRHGKTIDFDDENIEDPEVYDLISRGETIGLFQVEANGVKELCKKLKPDNFGELLAILALYRPGPIEAGMVSDFVERKHGRQKVSYFYDELTEALEPILKETYGLIVYQEQVMKIVQVIGGFSLGGADLVRRAMGKKNEDELNKLKSQFADGGVKNGYSAEHCEKLFNKILKFAGYGFNKSHSAAYAMITFQTAFLKRYYPTEFMASLLTSESQKPDKVVKYVDELKHMGYRLVPPHINKSQHIFSADIIDKKEVVVFGLGALKGAGGKVVQSILATRKDGEFVDMADFVSRIDGSKVNKRVVEALICSGAFDSFGHTRAALADQIEYIVAQVSNANRARELSVGSLFGDDKQLQTVELNLNELDEYDNTTMLQKELETLGFYVSGHPLDKYRAVFDSVDYVKSSEYSELKDGQQVKIAGKIVQIIQKISKKGNPYFVATIMDLHGSYDFMMFEKDKLKLENDFDINEPMVFDMVVKVDHFGVKFNTKSFKQLKTQKAKTSKPKRDSITIQIEENTDIGIIQTIHKIISNHQGSLPFTLVITGAKESLSLTSGYFVHEKTYKMFENTPNIEML